MIETIHSELSEGVLTLRLNRPEKYNALTNAMYNSLADTLFAANRNADIRALLITGGERFFTSGNDLKDFLESPPTHLDAPAFRFMKAVIELEKPLVAAVCGAAIGIGTTLLPHCDLVYITRNSKLSMPFVKLGLCQEFAASLMMPSILGPVRATQLLLGGDTFSGQQAADWGLANAAFDSSVECLEAAQAQARKLADAPQEALRTSRRLLRAPRLSPVRNTIREENEAFIARLQAEETRNALQAMVNGSKK
ncbi:enoyl-CoA hydratase-related protein [Stutzerimonas stutzeri]|nr:enoyl-CoA hydratase-related protein [Stutzerimonas stutzeri]MDH0426647.1 enoyl-CoA hydratase-related protein [Stutzerimonas stutzeri]